MLVKKYEPKKIKDIVGQKLAISKLIKFLNQNKKVIVYGPPGTGKTCSIFAIANDLNYEIVKLNDFKNIKEILGTGSIFGKKKIFLIDDIESINVTIFSLIKNLNFPIVVIALDLWDPRLKILRNYCEKVEFKKLSKEEIKKRLRYICSCENIKISDAELDLISENSNGDLRAAINDLEAMNFEQRDVSKNVFEALKKIFKQNFSVEVMEAFDLADLDVETGIMWISENICAEYLSLKSIADGYNFLSRSDLFLGRIKRRQYWGFYRYSNILATAGVNISKRKINPNFVRYKFPTKLIKLSKAKNLKKVLNNIAKKISSNLHTSSRIVIREYFPMFKIILNKSKGEFLGLKENEIDFLKNFNYS